MIVQIALIALMLIFLAKALASRATHATRAWKKIGLITLTGLMILTVLFPDATTRVANAVGVGRGADLLLYVVVISFIFYVFQQYIKQQDQRDALYRLARQVALMDAKQRYDK